MHYPAQVYVLLLNTGKYYVGLSHDPDKRFKLHRSLLHLGKHPVEDMQADYNASADKYLDYFILTTVETESERYREQQWQLALRTNEREFGYNYKDPTARRAMAEAEQRKKVKAYLKSRLEKGVERVRNHQVNRMDDHRETGLPE